MINPPRMGLLGNESVDSEEVVKTEKQKMGQGGTTSSDPMLCCVSGTGGDALEQGQRAAKSSAHSDAWIVV